MKYLFVDDGSFYNGKTTDLRKEMTGNKLSQALIQEVRTAIR